MSLSVEEVVYCISLVVIDAEVDVLLAGVRLENRFSHSRLPSFTGLHIEEKVSLTVSIIYT